MAKNKLTESCMQRILESLPGAMKSSSEDVYISDMKIEINLETLEITAMSESKDIILSMDTCGSKHTNVLILSGIAVKISMV